jgi:hypothetical protein
MFDPQFLVGESFSMAFPLEGTYQVQLHKRPLRFPLLEKVTERGFYGPSLGLELTDEAPPVLNEEFDFYYVYGLYLMQENIKVFAKDGTELPYRLYYKHSVYHPDAFGYNLVQVDQIDNENLPWYGCPMQHTFERAGSSLPEVYKYRTYCNYNRTRDAFLAIAIKDREKLSHMTSTEVNLAIVGGTPEPFLRFSH